MESREFSQNYRKVRSIRQKLLIELGVSFAQQIDREMPAIEEMHSNGSTYQEILAFLKEKHAKQRSYRQINSSFSSDQRTITRSLRSNRSRNSLILNKYHLSPSYSPMDNPRSHSMRNDYHYFAKLDELKALEAFKVREALEKKKEKEQMIKKQIDRRQLRLALDKQVEEKLKDARHLKLMEMKYRKAIDDRVGRILAIS